LDVTLGFHEAWPAFFRKERSPILIAPAKRLPYPEIMGKE